MKPETPNVSHATPHFWREMQMKTYLARQVDLTAKQAAHQEVDLFYEHQKTKQSKKSPIE